MAKCPLPPKLVIKGIYAKLVLCEVFNGQLSRLHVIQWAGRPTRSRGATPIFSFPGHGHPVQSPSDVLLAPPNDVTGADGTSFNLGGHFFSIFLPNPLTFRAKKPNFRQPFDGSPVFKQGLDGPHRPVGARPKAVKNAPPPCPGPTHRTGGHPNSCPTISHNG